MARSRALLLAVVAAALLALPARPAAAVNGGFFCQYVNYRDINQLMRDDGETNATVINDVINRMKNVDNYLCRSCSSTRMQKMYADQVIKGYGECRCKEGYGYWAKTNSAGKVVQRNYLCSKCPADKPHSDPTVGPYTSKPPPGALLKWSGTLCVP